VRLARCASPLVAAVLGGCASLPPLAMRSTSHAIESPAGSRLRVGIETVVTEVLPIEGQL
jgi:hypothetical protein